MAEYEAEEGYEGNGGGAGGGGGVEGREGEDPFPSSASSPQPLDQPVSKSRVRSPFQFPTLSYIQLNLI